MICQIMMYVGLSGQGIIFPARKIVGYPLILSRLPSNVHTVAARLKPGVRELSPEAEQPLVSPAMILIRDLVSLIISPCRIALF